MFQLDEKFLDDLGLAALPADAKDEFLQHIYAELESRVGERLTENMSDDLLDEFGNFVDQDQDGMDKWYSDNLPDYASREDYKQFTATNPDADPTAVKSQYGAMKWLQLNRPDYPQVVSTVLDELKEEIRSNREAILGGING
jgi:hypothetical protein